jgi:D,D-heptose 1,7-bisphosphate phosphatase
MTRAVFLDRDGVVNELVYFQEHEIIDSPFTARQFNILPGVTEAIKRFHSASYLVVVVSNQPGIAKGHMSEDAFEAIKQKMKNELSKANEYLDGEYYCLHHPESSVSELRKICDCRKPKPGLLLRASRDMHIELNCSWLIGDNISDIKAGSNAGCRTVLIGKMKCEVCALMEEQNTRPEKIAANLQEAAEYVLNN